MTCWRRLRDWHEAGVWPPRRASAISSTPAPGCRSRKPVHEVAQRAAPDDVVFVSYADNHPVALAHARALLTGPPGTIGHIDAHLNDPSALPALSWLGREHARSPASYSCLVINS
jgi:hypothetical protein